MEESVLKGALDGLPVNIAVLDTDADIIYTNKAWRDFGEREGGVAPCPPEENYLEVCDRAAEQGDEHAAEAAEGLRSLLSGDCDVFSFEYPCHSPTARRWFVMYAASFEMDGETHISVAHLNVTRRKLSEMEVEERNETLSEFAHSLSHDLRNPLNVASGYLEIELEENDSEDLRMTKSSLERMDEIITEVLELAESGTAVGDTELMGLGEAAREAWKNVETGDSKLVVEETNMRLKADTGQLLRMFENLYRNAVEHGDGAGNVTVRVGRINGGFYVEDDGKGIPADDVPDIFDKGRGLSIVREVVEGHGWELSVEESNEGGARFVVSLNAAIGY